MKRFGENDAFERRIDDIAADPLLALVPAHEQQAVLARTSELYAKSNDVVAPVIAGFGDHLLRTSEGRQTACAARDILGTYKVATKLQERFDYPDADPSGLKYAYLTRKVVWHSGSAVVKRHLQELDIAVDKGIVLADIGMYGSFIPDMEQIVPRLEVQYLISANPSIPGYAHGKSHQMQSMTRISGNPAVHFIEDTFSGPIKSPTALVEDENGLLVPNTVDAGYEPAVALMRKYALLALEDYVADLSEPPVQPATEAINRLDAFLCDPSQYVHLMVPHEK
jgi:hypothetical protein